MTRYQAYAWNGERYMVVSIPCRTEKEAFRRANEICSHPYEECNLDGRVHRFWKDKPIIVKEVQL